MNIARNRYRVLIICSLLILGLTISVAYNVAINKIEKAYQENVAEGIIEAKKNFLKDTVNNVILVIDRMQDEQMSYYTHLAEDIKKELDGLYATDNEDFLNSSVDLLDKNDNFSVIIIENEGGEILYSSIAATEGDGFLFDDEIIAVEHSSPVFAQFEYGKYGVIIYVEKENIDKHVKEQIHDEIHSFKFSNDAYIWVNEVINYNGGDNYAIRRVHPNLKDTEGMYLSTNMTDIEGNHPYLTELEGVKQNGELFFNYFFKKNNSDAVSEKITYAKLYPEYDWIIAMGVHLDDVESLVNQSTAQNARYINYIMMVVAAIIALLILIVLFFVSLLEKWYFKNTSKALNDEIYRDVLTIAYNRKGAESHLKSAFSSYRDINQNVAIIMLDIDDFKKINDECGHNTGDIVLKQTAELLNRHIRSTDYLCRWGGDEFLIICHGLREDDVIPFTNKLLNVVSEFEYECSDNNHKRSITISMGVSSFKNSDTDYNDSIIRADKALYRSKSQGKNRVSVEQ